MLVRSQDNQKITENIDFTTVENKKREYEIRHVESWRLYGTYFTLKKAIKALDMMERMYRHERTTFQFPAEEEVED